MDIIPTSEGWGEGYKRMPGIKLEAWKQLCSGFSVPSPHVSAHAYMKSWEKFCSPGHFCELSCFNLVLKTGKAKDIHVTIITV